MPQIINRIIAFFMLILSVFMPARSAEYEIVFTDVSREYIKAEYKNTAFDVVSLGNAFYIEKQNGEDWEAVPFSDSVFFTEISETLMPGQSKTYIIDSVKVFGAPLEDGVYRIVIENISGYRQSAITAYGVFEIHSGQI